MTGSLKTLARRSRSAIASALGKVLLVVRPAGTAPAPYPVFVRRTGLGAEISVDSLAEALLGALMTEVAEDPEGVAEEARYLAQTDGPERDRLLEDLVERLGGASIRLAARDARRLADRLNAAAGPIQFPRQKSRSAA